MSSKRDRWGSGRGGRPWRRLRDAVAVRDLYTCQSCGAITESGECDHIVPTFKGGDSDMSNLQWLCRDCHAGKTARESAEAQGRNVRGRVAIDADGWPIMNGKGQR